MDIDSYIDQLRKLAAGAKSLSLEEVGSEIEKLHGCSPVFDDFEKQAIYVDKKLLDEISNFDSLFKIRRLASEIKAKKNINGMLESLHSLVLDAKKASSKIELLSAVNSFLHGGKSKASFVIDELNDFRRKLAEVERHHSQLMPKSLDGRLALEKRAEHIGRLHEVHAMQSKILKSIAAHFIRHAKKHINPKT